MEGSAVHIQHYPLRGYVRVWLFGALLLVAVSAVTGLAVAAFAGTSFAVPAAAAGGTLVLAGLATMVPSRASWLPHGEVAFATLARGRRVHADDVQRVRRHHLGPSGVSLLALTTSRSTVRLLVGAESDGLLWRLRNANITMDVRGVFTARAPATRPRPRVGAGVR